MTIKNEQSRPRFKSSNDSRFSQLLALPSPRDFRKVAWSRGYSQDRISLSVEAGNFNYFTTDIIPEYSSPSLRFPSTCERTLLSLNTRLFPRESKLRSFEEVIIIRFKCCKKKKKRIYSMESVMQQCMFILQNLRSQLTFYCSLYRQQVSPDLLAESKKKVHLDHLSLFLSSNCFATLKTQFTSFEQVSLGPIVQHRPMDQWINQRHERRLFLPSSRGGKREKWRDTAPIR